MIRRSLLTAPVLGFLTFVATPANAADLVGGYYAPQTKVTSTRYSVLQECFLLKVTQYGTSEIVQTCYPPLELNPRTRVTAGSSGGTRVVTTTSYTVQR
jgi:hypothetical protein